MVLGESMRLKRSRKLLNLKSTCNSVNTSTKVGVIANDLSPSYSIITKIGDGPPLKSFIACGKEDCGAVRR